MSIKENLGPFPEKQLVNRCVKHNQKIRTILFNGVSMTEFCCVEC